MGRSSRLLRLLSRAAGRADVDGGCGVTCYWPVACVAASLRCCAAVWCSRRPSFETLVSEFHAIKFDQHSNPPPAPAFWPLRVTPLFCNWSCRRTIRSSDDDRTLWANELLFSWREIRRGSRQGDLPRPGSPRHRLNIIIPPTTHDSFETQHRARSRSHGRMRTCTTSID